MNRDFVENVICRTGTRSDQFESGDAFHLRYPSLFLFLSNIQVHIYTYIYMRFTSYFWRASVNVNNEWDSDSRMRGERRGGTSQKEESEWDLHTHAREQNRTPNKKRGEKRALKETVINIRNPESSRSK